MSARSLLAAAALIAAAGAASGDIARANYLIGPLERYDPVAPAWNTGASAVVNAPALLALDRRPEVIFGRFATDGAYENDQALYIRGRSFGFGTESVSLPGEEEMRRYTLSLSSSAGGRSAVGLSYTFHTSDDGDLRGLSSLDLSGAYRPARSLSFHFAARNLGRVDFRGGRIDRFYEAGFSAVGRSDRFGVFLQGRLVEGARADEGELFAGAHLRASRSLLLRGRIDDHADVVAGAEVLFRQFAVGFNYFTDGDGGEGGFSYFRIFAIR